MRKESAGVNILHSFLSAYYFYIKNSVSGLPALPVDDGERGNPVNDDTENESLSRVNCAQ